jgi:hypothetical protein
MCPESKVILAKKSEIEQGQARPTSPSISFPQRAFGFLAPLSFAYLMFAAPLLLFSQSFHVLCLSSCCFFILFHFIETTTFYSLLQGMSSL